MIDFDAARRQMVDCQIRPNDVTDYDIIDAFSTVPRELFVPSSKKAIAYSDADVDLDGRSLGQVMPLAKMLQVAEISNSDVVLCIGSGAGYGAAIVSRLANSVIAVESNEDLVARSSETLLDLAYDNVAVVQAELEVGCPSEAPFDVILVEGAVSTLPQALLDQLRDEGRLVAVEGEGLSGQIRVYSRHGDDISATGFSNVAVPRLPGFQRADEFVF